MMHSSGIETSTVVSTPSSSMDKRSPGSGDPYYVAQDEVTTAVKKARELYQQWRRELDNGAAIKSANVKRLEDDLVSELRQISFDLEDIKTTIQVVEKNPTRFQVPTGELQRRKQFVEDTKKTVRDLQANVVKRQSRPTTSASVRMDARNRDFVDSHSSQQQVLMQQQDEQLEELAMSADRLHQTAVVINEELEDQQRMLSELDENIDREVERMNFVMRRLGRLLKSNGTLLTSWDV
eukprot:GHVQ01004782.1.p1 GENE.GHVQ01004782.1~~GHVQ01004782.1.p1  ORF type:complete len:237 (-),score=44.52 GHVQ01004782.1:389-1099(-)